MDRLQPLTCVCLRLISTADHKGTALSVRMTRWTGKSHDYRHPKHLIDTPDHHWYVSDLKPGWRVLDVGCNNGSHSCWAATVAEMVVGIDYDREMLHRATADAARRGLHNVHVLGASAQDPFPFRGSQFDAALFLDVIEHLNHRDVALHEIHRALKPDGLLFLAAPNVNTRWKRRLKAAGLFCYADPDHKIEYTWDGLRDDLARGGFEPIRDPEPIVCDTPLSGLIDLAGGFSLALYARLCNWKRQQARAHPEDTVGWRVVCRKRTVCGA